MTTQPQLVSTHPSLCDSDAFDFEYGTVILRMEQGLDVSHIVEAAGQRDFTVHNRK